MPQVLVPGTSDLDPFSWDIEVDTYGDLTPVSDGVQDFVMIYTISDRHYDVELLKEDCSTASTFPSDPPVLNTDNSIIDGVNNLAISFRYNQSLFQESNLWNVTAKGGEVDFCIKLTLYNDNSPENILFNVHETTYKIEVDLTAGFSTEVDVVRTTPVEGGVEIVDVQENITVFQCDDDYNQIFSPPALAEGSSLQICVETEAGSSFEVASIQDTTVSQNGTKVFPYINNYQDSFWAVSSCNATNTKEAICKVKMQLLGSYFDDADPADLDVVGTVKMDYLGASRRLRLGDGDEEGKVPNRKIEEYDNTGSQFSLVVPMGSTFDENEVSPTTGDENIGTSLEPNNDMSSSVDVQSTVYASIMMIISSAYVLVIANMV